ncbi:hypothetical protein AC1031_010234 [Aphanomyces cochlioides]|nr:hypothetical protein AC1031_010234 [Aphanomyces cochlioides]
MLMNDLFGFHRYSLLSSTEVQQTPRGRRRYGRWMVRILLINLVELTAESARGIVMPTLFLYCQSLGGTLVTMGLLTSAFSVGRLLSSFFFGWLCDRCPYRTVYLLASACGVVGNVIYLFADSKASVKILLLSRFVVGLGAGNRSVCRADVARMTSVSDRLKYMNRLSLTVFLGYALTPGIVWDIDVNFLGLSFTALTAPGLILALMNALTFGLLLCLYDESITPHDGQIMDDIEAPQPAKRETEVYEPTSKLLYLGVAVFMALNVVGRGILSIFETINVPMYLAVAQASNSASVTSQVLAASTFQFQAGLLGLFCYGAIEFAGERIAQTTWLYIGLAALGAGDAWLALRWPSPSFGEFTGAIFCIWSIGSPLLTAVSVAAFSTILGNRQQGTWMGILGSAASASRILLPLLPPLFVSFAPMFWLAAILSMLGIALLAIYQRLVLQDIVQWRVKQVRH